jgi:hypothetical protein
MDEENDRASSGSFEFENLFLERSSDDEIFYFSSIDIQPTSSSSKINFNFSYREVSIVATMGIDFDLSDIQNNSGSPENRRRYKTIVSIGMCKLLWYQLLFINFIFLVYSNTTYQQSMRSRFPLRYWMGFGCPVIAVSSSVCHFTSRMHDYWEHFYSQLLLEFCFVHGINALPMLKTNVGEEVEIQQGFDNSHENTIDPIWDKGHNLTTQPPIIAESSSTPDPVAVIAPPPIVMLPIGGIAHLSSPTLFYSLNLYLPLLLFFHRRERLTCSLVYVYAQQEGASSALICG